MIGPMEPAVGLEPTTYGLQNRCSIIWSQMRQAALLLVRTGKARCSLAKELFLLEPAVGLEPTTYGLQNRCSTG